MFSITTDDIPVAPMPDIEQKPFWDNFKGLSFDEIVTRLSNGLISFAFKVAMAILVFYIGKIVIRYIYSLVLKIMTRRKVDPSLTTFVVSLVKITLYFILIVSVIGILGLETSSFLALFASAGVAVGMALSGTLQNFAGGVLILLLKPYKVGDFIEVQGYQGKVKSIQLFNTVINTIDNKAIIIPNGMLSTSSVNNYSLEHYRRVDWTISLAYGTDLRAAKETIMEFLIADRRIVKRYVEDDEKYRERIQQEKLLEQHPELAVAEQERRSLWDRIMHRRARRKLDNITTRERTGDQVVSIPEKVERKPFVALQEMADSSINLVVRAWTHSSNYWDLYFEMNEKFYTELPKRGFEFPFPQLDVHTVGN